MSGFRVAILICCCILVTNLVGQPPLQLNTTVRSFTSVSGTPWVADIWSYTDGQGRDFALVCRGNSGFSVYEITNPAAPVFASSIPLASGSDLKDVKVFQNYAYALQQSGQTNVVDLTNPYAISVVNTISGTAHNGFFDTTGPVPLYLQSRNGANPANLRIYDVSNPANPVFLSAWDPPSGDTHDAYAQDGLAYVSVLFGNAEGTYILDISNPSSPQFLSVVPSGGLSHSSWMYNAPGGQKVLCSANETAGGHIKMYDVTDPMNTPLLSEYITPTGANISVHNPVVVGRYCYIAYYADYLRILDMARPSHPVEVGTYDPNPSNIGAGTFDGAWGVAYVKPLPNGDHRLLLTESFATNRGFWVIDFTPPEVPSLALSTTGVGDVSLQVSGAVPFSEIFTGVSLDSAIPFGSGLLAGIGVDAFFTLLLPLNSQPFHVVADAAGAYSFNLPAASLPSGLEVDVVSIAMTSTNGWQPTEVGRIQF